MNDLVFTPTDFVAILNQTLEYAYPSVTIEGELSNLRVSRGKWAYFDVKDETSSIKCFGAVFVLPGPLEDGMMIRIVAQPRLHPLYNFSLNLQSVTPVGEGSLKKAADLLQAKLQKEGLFDEDRKRAMPYAPQHVGLIASKQSAAYADFVKILDARWAGVRVSHIDVQVQGEQAVLDIVKAVEHMNQLGDAPEVLIVTRGGGSAEDLAAFSTEQVTRAIAASRIPTLVAIGHEIDLSLAELAADRRASTPSNAAELLVPDKHAVSKALKLHQKNLDELLGAHFKGSEQLLKDQKKHLSDLLQTSFTGVLHNFERQKALLEALSPQAALKRGYAVIKAQGKVVRSVSSLKPGQRIGLTLHDGTAQAQISTVE